MFTTGTPLDLPIKKKIMFIEKYQTFAQISLKVSNKLQQGAVKSSSFMVADLYPQWEVGGMFGSCNGSLDPLLEDFREDF